jgi:hypothetical protein
MEVRSTQASEDGNACSNEPGADGSRSSGDLLRRVVWVVLALYLAPVFLLVLLVGGLAMVVLALVRVCNRILRGPFDPQQGLGLGAFSPSRPHIGITSGLLPRVGR